MTDGSGTTNYSYDADDDLTGISYSDAPSGMSTPSSVTYSYDADGNRTEMTDGTGTTTYTYNSLEELVSVEDGAGNTVTYGYDADGNRTCLSYPNSGSDNCSNSDSGTGIVTYAYDDAGELTQMTDWLGNTTNFSYDADGELTSTTLPSATDTIVDDAYDAASNVTDTYTDAAGTTTELASLTRNADDLIASTTPSSGDTSTYGYDSLNELTTGQSGAYTYDAAGELTSSTPNGGSTTDYSYNADGQLCWTGSTTGSCQSPPSGATTLSYDSAGNRISSTPAGGNPTTYGYDQAGDLVCETAANSSGYSCSDPDTSVTSTYTYNGDGLRMSATPAGGSTELFTWDTTSSVPELLEDGTNYYLYGPSVGSAPIEQISVDGSVPSYLVSDTTGVREQLGSSGDIVGSMSYSDYGVPCGSCSTSTPFGFEGSYTDPTGLVYVVHRYYDPQTGQFLSVDPLVNETSEPYSYASGDPANRTDPSGLCNDVQGVHVYNGPCTGAQLAQIESAAVTARAAGVATACSNFLSCSVEGIEHPSLLAASFVANKGQIATGVGIILGAASLATGVGEVAGATIALGDLTISSAGLGAISLATGAVGTGLDAGRCFGGDAVACVGFGLSIPGALAGIGDLALPEGLLPEGVMRAIDYAGLGTGALGFGWDLGSELPGMFLPGC